MRLRHAGGRRRTTREPGCFADEVGAAGPAVPGRCGAYGGRIAPSERGTALQLGREAPCARRAFRRPGPRLEGHHELAGVVWLGNADAARRHLDQGMALYDQTAAPEPRVYLWRARPGVCCRKVASWASWILGYPERGLEESVDSLRLARDSIIPRAISSRWCGRASFATCGEKSTSWGARSRFDRLSTSTRLAMASGGDDRRGSVRAELGGTAGDRPDQPRARGLWSTGDTPFRAVLSFLLPART